MSTKKTKKVITEVDVEDNQQSDNEAFSDEEGDIIDGIRIPPPTKPNLTLDPNGPRLIITKIVNNFFKSYVNEVLGPFHKCFNAIVGPNGSGKSNVIDSMLFVFGYRATKIRSKKVSVLLHNSEQYRNVQSCTVSVHFAQIIDEEGDNYKVVEGSEFVVSRTAHKDNSSYYTIDGRRVQFKEVGLLLKSHGIDLKYNRFLILQGEVEQISMMSCKAENEHDTGMLEYIEDIIGTTRYKKPLKEMLERVEYLTEQRTEKLNRFKLVEKEMEELQGPMEEAVGFLKIENTIANNKNILYQKNILEIQDTLEELDKEMKEVSEVKKEFEDNLTKLKEEKVLKEQELEQKSAGYDHLVKKKEKIKEGLNKAINQDTELQEKMKQTLTKRKKNKELIITEKQKLEDFAKVPETSKSGIEECQQKIENETAKKDKLEEDKRKLLLVINNETKGLQEQKEVIENELIGLKQTVDETKNAFLFAESELKTYVSKEENEKKLLDDVTQELENVQMKIKDRTKQISILKTKIPATDKSLKDSLQELNQVKIKEAHNIDELKSNRRILEEKRSSMQANSSRGRVLDALMEQKRQGNCPGLYGRLGDLGAIDKKYDVAISTACGPLDNIVVDTVATGQWCIEYLKKHDLGRVTFITLDKQEYLRERADEKIKVPENVHRLFDLVRVQDETVKTAFYYALRDTLVANDIEQATRIAYGEKRFRVVTLNGDLIETTGTMSGGGKQVSRGRMGQSVRVSNVNPKELENMEEDISKMEHSIRELRQRQTQLEDQVNVLQPQLRQMKIDLENFTVELKDLEKQKPILEKQYKEQVDKSKAIKADPKRVKEMTINVEQKKKLYDAAAEKSDVLQKQIETLNEEIEDKTTGKMRVINKKIKECTSIIDKNKAEISKFKVAITTAERDTVKSNQKIAKMEQDVVNMENNLRSMKEEREVIEEDARKLQKWEEELTEQIAAEEESFSDIKKSVAALVKEENKLKSEKVEIDQRYKTVKGKVNECNGRINLLEEKIKKLELREIPNESLTELKRYVKEDLENINIEDTKKELESAENHLKVAKPNLNAITEYRYVQNQLIERSKDLESVNAKRTTMRKLYDDLKLKRREEFLTGFNIIRMKLKEVYQMITLGGDADFEMVDGYDPFSEGIQFNVRPPKKSWKKIANLSGGEKTLSSLALIFALHYYKPSPLYVMDEIDAALDFKNVSIVGNYIKQRTKNAQFIIISLRSNMFELGDYLLGIFKTYNCTKSITIDTRKFDKKNEEDSQNGVVEIQVGTS